MYTRENTRCIMVRDVPIGGGNPVTIQSMTNTDTRDVTATVEQIRRLISAGCDLVRIAVPDTDAAEALSKIRREIPVPLIADIHFKPISANRVEMESRIVYAYEVDGSCPCDDTICRL